LTRQFTRWSGRCRAPLRTISGSTARCLEAFLILKSLEIAGFKSFARPTRLEFPEGITAFVGANGSGKSNVVDAIRWCMGEQSARDLRGQRAEDVIYAGPRRVLGSAEVTLTLEADSSEASWTELSVARRLFRSGESEYLLNRRRERLRDVQTTLRGAGIDNPRFVVVNQGMTDFLLSATPGERRALLEHAAGLSGYRARRDEALHKLQAAEANILTVEAVLAELEPRLRSLRRQARAVEERAGYQARCRTLLEHWYAWHWARLSQNASDLSEQLAASLEDRRSAEEALRELEEIFDADVAREREWQASMSAASAASHAAERELQEARYEMRRLTDARRAAGEEADSLDGRRRDVSGRLAELEGRRVAAAQDLVDISATVSLLEANRGEMRSAYEAVRAEASAAGERAGAAQRSIDAAARDFAAAAHERQSIAVRLGFLAERLSELSRSGGDLQAEAAEVEGQVDMEERRLALALEQEALSVSRHRDAERVLGDARVRLGRVGELRQRASGRRSALTEHLSQTRRSLSALSQSVADSPLLGLRVEAGWEPAVAAALSGGNDRATRRGVTRDFLEWRDGLTPYLPAGSCWADAVVASTTSLPNVLYGTVLTEDGEQARTACNRVAGAPGHVVGSPAIQFVTRDGAIFSASWLGHRPADDRGARYLVVKAEEATLTRMLAVSDGRLERLAALESAQKSEVERQQAKAGELGAHASRLRREASEAERAVAAARLRQDRVLHLVEARAAERAALESEQAALAEQSQAVERQLEDARSRFEDLEVARQDADRRAARLSQVLEVRREEWERAESGRQVAVARREGQERMLALAEAEGARLLEELERIDREQGALLQRLQRLESDLEGARSCLDDLGRVVAAHGDRLADLERVRPQRDDLGEQLRAARARVSDSVGRHERFAARVAEVQAERMRLSAEAQQELGLQVSQLPPPLPEPPSQEELRRVRARAAQYADLDETVVQEYREAEARLRYLTEQADDLRRTGHGLREVVRVADEEMLIRFEGALTSVSVEFERVFRLMLPGSRASLTVCDQDGGVDVQATLPGKRARSSAAFSGGERALVASALLFAVLHIRPTPFVVLDEVDAALDETNVDRYLAALADVAARTQVLVVTHNRATMAAANVLYGLTIDRDGVSSVLSLRLDEYEATG
jgi:chromosome segregation protein